MIPVSLSGGVEPGARTGTSVNGQLVVVWRGQDGTARAWTDRCPHRGMRLSFGYVRRNTLTCVYHGWSFSDTDGGGNGAGGAGRCQGIPAHPGLTPPDRAAVPALPVAEALGMIWVGTSPADTQPPPGAEGRHRDVYPVRSVTVHAPPAALRAAFETTLPPGTETAETGDTAGTADIAETPAAAGGVITFKGPSALVIAAIQDRGDGSSTAHVVSTDANRATRRALCQWAALVRDHLAAVVLP